MGGFSEEAFSSLAAYFGRILKMGHIYPDACDRSANIPVHHGPLLAYWEKKTNKEAFCPP